MVDALAGHTAAQNTLGSEGLRDGDSLSSTSLSNLLQGLRGNGIVRLQDTAYGSTRNAVNTQPGAVTRATTHTLTVQGGYAVLDGVLYEFAGGPGGTATVTIGTHGTGTALAASGEQSMYSVYIASQGGQAKIHADGGSPVQTSTGLYPQLPTQFLVDYDTGGSIANDQVVVLATLRCSYNASGGTHKVDVQEVNDKRIFTRSNPIYMTPLSSGTIVTDGSELSQISRGAAEGINTAAQLNALFSGNEVGALGTNANGSVKIDVGALWMSTGRSGTSLGYGPGNGIDRGSNRMMDDLFFAGQENSEVGVVTKRLFTEGVSAPTGTLSTASYTISSHGDKWFIFAPANGATVTLNPEKSGSSYLFPEGHVVEVCNSAAANGGNIVFDSTGLNTTLLPDQRATFIYEGSTWLRCDYQAAISTMAFTTLTDTPSSLGTAGQHIRVNSGGTAFEFIDSPTLTTEAVQDVVGAMVSGNTETNITVTYEDGDGTLDFVVAEQRTDAQVKDLAGAMFTGNTETFITATYEASDDTVDLVVPVKDEDDMASNSATFLATQQSIKAYVDTTVAGVIDGAPGALDTLNELAAAINDDSGFHTTVTTALTNRLRVDTASQGLTGTQQSNARTNLGLGSMATLSAIDISANTNLAVSAPIILTGDTLSIDDIPFSALHADAVQISSESFADNDTTLMTSASIQDKILSYGYSTTTGTVTSVATGTGLTGGAVTSTGTISLSHLGLESLADPDADRIMFWDDDAGALKWLTAGSNLSISGTSMTATNTNQLTTFSIRDDDDDAKVVAQDKFIKFVSATGTAGTNWSGAGTTGDPWVMTITSPDTNTQLTGAQVKDFAGAMFTGNTETFITATYQTGDDTVDLVVPVHDEDDMSSNSASHLATQQSIKAYVDTEVSGLIDSAPGALDTLNELAAAINDDASFHSTMTTALAARLRVDTASQGLTGTQQSNARTNLGLGSMALLSSIDISDNTNLAAGTGIDLTGDTVSVDVSDFMANGSDNRVVTAASADTMNAEANLVFDGTSLGVGTTSPMNTLQVNHSPGDGNQGIIIVRDDATTAADEVLGGIGFDSTDGNVPSSVLEASAAIAAYAAEGHGTGDKGGYLTFLTSAIDDDDDTTSHERMRIASDGKVGIGNTNPTSALDVTGSVEISSNLFFNGAGNHYIKHSSGTASSDTFTFRFSDNEDVMIIRGDGRVGINTTSPEYELDVTGGLRILPTIASHAGTAIRIGPQDNDIDVTLLRVDGNGGGAGTGNSGESDDSNYGYSIKYMGSGTGTANRYALWMDNSAGTAFEAMTVLQDGKVGISDSTPSYKLDVAGDINLTGTLRVNGTAQTLADAANNATITLAAGTGLSTGGNFTTNQSSDETITFNVSGLTVSELAANSLQLSSESFADNDTSLMTSAAIADKIESYGYSTTSGDITEVVAGVGLSGGGASGSTTLTVDLSELPDMTQAVTANADELIILDAGASKRKMLNEIPLSAFNNDSGFVTNTSSTNLNATNDRDLAPEDLNYANDFQVFFTSKEGLEDGSTSGSNYQDTIVLNTWNDGTGGDANILAFDKSTKAISHYQADQAATNWGTASQLAYTSDIGDALSFDGSTANGVLTYKDADEISVESTLTYDPSGQLAIYPASGYGRIEMGGSAGAYIDMKNDSSDDFDVRLITDGTGLDITTSGGSSPIVLKTNGTQRMKIEDAQTTMAHHLTFGTTSNPYIKAGTGGPLAIWGDEDGLATSYSSNTPTYSTAASLQLRVNASNQTAMEIQNNKDIKTYGFLKSGSHSDVYGANTFVMGVTGSTADNDWFEVFRWTGKTDGGSDANNWQYDNFQATFQVTARGIGRSNFDLHVRGEYGTQDSNGWWTTEFIIDSWDDNVADNDTTFRMVYNAGTGGSTPYASLYQKRDEDWEYRQIKLIQCFTNCYFDYLNTNVGETDPTHDTEAGSSNVDPSIRRKLYVDANEQLINGVTATGIYLDNEDEELVVKTATNPIIRAWDTTDNYSATITGQSSGAWLALGDMDSAYDSWMKLGAYSGINNLDTKTRDFHLFGTNTTTGFYFDESAGRFGIGTTSPDGSLHIAESGHQILTLERTVNNTNYGSGIHFQAGDSASTTAGHNYAAMYGVVEDNTDGAEDGYIGFHTSLAGTLAEKMRITSAGYVGIGTTSPAEAFHVVGADSGPIAKFERSGQESVLISGNNGWGNLYTTDAVLGFGTGSSSGANSKMVISGDNVGIGTTSPTTKLAIYHAVTNPALDGEGAGAFAMDIDIDLSGSGATGGDKEQGGLYVDLDTSTTGGDTSDEHRPYGVWVDARVNSAGDPDALYGGYFYTEAQRTSASTSQLTNQIGVYGYATSDETADNTVSSLQGVRGDFSVQDAGVVSHSYAVRGYGAVHSNRTTNVGDIHGLAAEIDIAGSRTDGSDITTGSVRVVEAVFDHNCAASGQGTVTVGNSYLYYGNSAVTDSAQVTNEYGIYLTGETKNYFSGNVGIGTDSPDTKLHVEGSVLVDAYNVGEDAGLFFREGFLTTDQPSITVWDMTNSGASPDGLSLNALDGIRFRENGGEVARFSDGSLGIGTTSPTATLEVAGDAVLRRSEIIALSSNTNLSGISHAGRVLNCTSACTLSLQATPTEGEQYVIYNNSSGTITIAANGSDTINGSTNDMTITSQYKALTIIALSASAWIAIGA